MGSISRRGKGKGTVLRGQQGMTSSPRHEGIDTLISRPAGAEGRGFARRPAPRGRVSRRGGRCDPVFRRGQRRKARALRRCPDDQVNGAVPLDGATAGRTCCRGRSHGATTDRRATTDTPAEPLESPGTTASSPSYADRRLGNQDMMPSPSTDDGGDSLEPFGGLLTPARFHGVIVG